MANTSILAAFERMWQHIVAALGNKSDISHNHDDVYYTESEIDTKISNCETLIDAITVPTKVSELTNDSGYIASYTETDPTVPSWAKASTKPSYTASEVGALPLSGGTMTGEIAIGQGDGKGIQLGTNGRINATVGTNTAATMFGVSSGVYYLGHSGFSTTIRGSKTRPTYNAKDMALYSDVTSLSSEVANKMPNVAVTTSDNGKFLRVVDGAWAAATIPNAEEASF